MNHLTDRQLLEMINEHNRELQRLIDKLTDRVEEMERSWGRPGVYPIQPLQPYKMADTCPTCGLRLDQGSMGYVCSMPKCPTGHGGPWC